MIDDKISDCDESRDCVKGKVVKSGYFASDGEPLKSSCLGTMQTISESTTYFGGEGMVDSKISKYCIAFSLLHMLGLFLCDRWVSKKMHKKRTKIHNFY